MDGERGKQQIYLAYMLRLWQAGSRDGLPVWRASLENPHTGERLVFGDVAGLFAFLSELLASAAEARTPYAPGAALPGDAGRRAGPAAPGEDLVE
jgi:hypothetical protein